MQAKELEAIEFSLESSSPDDHNQQAPSHSSQSLRDGHLQKATKTRVTNNWS